MLGEMITEGDKNQKPVDLSVDSLKKFLKSYEQLRVCEKQLIQKGHSEKLFTRGKIYGRLIKVFATRPSNPQQTRRLSM